MKELEILCEKVENCKRCELWKTRNKVVFGEGPDDAEILLVGLGPGYYENLVGRPFIGPAGKLLNELLGQARLKRESVYITNIIKSYLPQNRAKDEQIETCAIYLNKQIDILKPKFIILLGNVATEYIFKKFGLPIASMRHLHGKIFSISTLLMNFKIIPMYHPAAVLRNPALRKTVEKDWKTLRNLLQ